MKKPALALLLALTLVFSLSGMAYAADTEPTAQEETAITVSPMAAPDIAGIILEKEGVKANQSIGQGKSKTQLNLISEVARNMGPQTLFNGIEESITIDGVKVCNPNYWQEVLEFLNGYGFTFTYTLDDYIKDLNGGGDDEPALPATSNWLMHVDMGGFTASYNVVMNVDGSTISGTITQNFNNPPIIDTFSGTLVGQKFTGTWVFANDPTYVGAIEWTFNATFDGLESGDFWYLNDTGDPYAYYEGPIIYYEMIP